MKNDVTPDISKQINCECGNNTFKIRLDKTNNVGLITCSECKKNFLILDSINYWYDIIQEKYPSILKCRCKHNQFYMTLNYILREDKIDVKEIDILTICNNCSKEKIQNTWQIDYGPTQNLIDNPITFCPKPKIKIKQKEITCYWVKNDSQLFLDFMLNKLSLNLYCFERGKNDYEKTDFQTAIERDDTILTYFFSQHELTDFHNLEHDYFSEKSYYKKNEVVKLSSPFNIVIYGKLGLLYYINFSNEYIQYDKIISKSEQFLKLTNETEGWIQSNYVNLRGKDCYDNEQEHIRIFGDEYISKKKNKP